ncbi:30S ribosomal protein S5 [Candidatus Roizmanbacteria bacterium CG_4_10_14_0_8_um_filter_39_9]|uniref:Small ribosomal subunit protein uS5 n=1 Tax=Candidatus Roizmanbacteria bacterium CG_4_10_14_0_8_um_filter_39_9 TaxID=1974829 RepID=A0A2M7QC05_9BACT|nr:MAG: 30S ribosomal protein S5 [Candidatus Roizmanbacteria bacterium CG_4_10_14_0_8_um_filter_39_9]
MIEQKDETKLEERILTIKRVTKKTTGGNYVTFSALVVVGNGRGSVGIGLGRGLEVPQAIRKAVTQAKKHMLDVPIYKSTIPHEVKLKYKAGFVLLRPAPEGTGLKIGSVARVIFDLAGIHNASGKIIGSRNQTVNTYLIMEALKSLKARSLPVEEKKDK